MSDSYYGRPVLKPLVWEWPIAAYLFAGGLSAGSALLAAGADLTGRPALRRSGRLGALASLAAGTYFLVADLGRPERFHHMLRVAKPTSPMSVGTWLLAAYGPGIGLAAMNEVLPARFRRDRAARAAGVWAGLLAPAVASYPAVLFSQTAVPAWHDSHRELPFVFTGSAAASAGGLGMVLAPVVEAGPARRLAVVGGVAELLASRRMEHRPGVTSVSFRSGRAASLLTRARVLTAVGVVGAAVLGRRSRVASVVAGAALLAGGAYERLGVFEAGRASAVDPAQTVGPQRDRLQGGRSGASTSTPRSQTHPNRDRPPGVSG